MRCIYCSRELLGRVETSLSLIRVILHCAGSAAAVPTSRASARPGTMANNVGMESPLPSMLQRTGQAQVAGNGCGAARVVPTAAHHESEPPRRGRGML
jgi:hypothetical protein